MPSPDVRAPAALAESPSRPSQPMVWLGAGRLVSLTATASPAVATLLACRALGLPIDWAVAGVALLGVMLLQLGVNLDNDVEDDRRMIDQAGRLGGSGVIQRGWLAPRAMRRAAYALFAAGLVCGLPAFVRAPVPLAIVAALVLAGGLGYSGRPFGLKYRALGDLAVLLLCGPALTLGMGAAATAALVPALLPLGIAFGLLAVGILHSNNWQDIDIDRAAHAKTVASLIGPAWSRGYLVALYVGAAVAWIGAAIALSLPVWATALPLVACIPSARLLARVLRAGDLQAPAFALLRVEAAQLHLAWGVLFCVALATSAMLGIPTISATT